MFGLFDEWKMRRRLAQFGREIDEFETRHSAAFEKAKKAGADYGELDDLAGEYFAEKRLIEDTLLSERSNYLIQIAKVRLVPYPIWSTESEHYEPHERGHRIQLTLKAQSDLLAAIRRDIKEGDENLRAWGALLVGIFGAAIGLITVITKAFTGG